MASIDIKDLVFGYDKTSETVLEIHQWRLQNQQSIFLQGPSGSGKSTFLNLIAGILLPQHGSIRLLGTDITQLTNAKRDQFRAQHLGVVFQQFNLISYLSIAENLRLAAHFAGQKNVAQKRIDALLEALHLPASLSQHRANQLSVGQQQRVAIARALINQPQILIVDEPTSALDQEARDSFMNLLLEVSKDKACSLLFVSHDRSLSTHFDDIQDLREINGAISRGEANAI